MALLLTFLFQTLLQCSPLSLHHHVLSRKWSYLLLEVLGRNEKVRVCEQISCTGVSSIHLTLAYISW